MGEACLESVPDLRDVVWTFRIDGRRAEWDWGQGAPEVTRVQPVRRPRSGAASRHVPVRAFCVSVGDYLELESGLEHDLLRLLDRDSTIAWLGAQPFELEWAATGRGRRRRHTPDLLSLGVDGRVTVWDVKRPTAAEFDRFATDRAITERACAGVGWSYRVFTGLAAVHRNNLMWLHSYRRPPAWISGRQDALIEACVSAPTLGELMSSVSDADRAVVWHLVWTGGLKVDLTSRMTRGSRVTA